MKTFVLGSTEQEVNQLLPEGQIKAVQLGPNKVCVTQSRGKFFAFETLCPHQKAPLAQGFITKFQELVCPLHSYRFNLETGQPHTGDCPDLKLFPCELTSEGLKIKIEG